MNDFIEKFKDGLVVKVDRENIKKFLEIIQCYSEICWANTLSPMDINPFFGIRQEKYLYIFYDKKISGMQVFLYRETVGKEIYDFQNFKLDLEEQVVFRKSIAKFLTEKCQ
jgi:hypothetical protein